MRDFAYCPDCGTPLEKRNLGDETDVPWCSRCERPWFALFPVASIALVYDDSNRVLLLEQPYISAKYRNLVSGYIKSGESAENCIRREIFEETGLRADRVELMMTHWFEKKEMLMICFLVHTSDQDLHISTEVKSAFWCDPWDITELLNPSPESTSHLLALKFLERIKL